MRVLSWIILTLSFCSCSIFSKKNGTQNAEKLEDFYSENSTLLKGYQPIDPVRLPKSEKEEFGTIDCLPNEASRLVIGKLDNLGTLSYGSFNVARKGQSYSVIVDYIKYQTLSLSAQYAESNKIISNDEYKNLVKAQPSLMGILPHFQVEVIDGKIDDATKINPKKIIYTEQQLKIDQGKIQKSSFRFIPESSEFSEYNVDNALNIPVYVGIGLRIQANITALKDSVNIGNLFGLGFAASENKIVGSLVIQTLGISGEKISSALPIPDKINESTIQAAIQAVGVIKSKIYDKDTHLSPQIVAFSLPVSMTGAKDLMESSLQKFTIEQKK
ncbi:hypothetical protein LZD49_32170 [Dyadobacter sp. CY261]|uniref:hypothetical protein n=1 Tax=Dyadobacter sp. CY261 TaxID=2907203 RepID=UPI001F280E70|nr:hypothetical protein [Dyadobacter sp. CY261]MCF0075184.1 hypothetical protein [Dyadobacter sp. CY261]